MKNLLLPLVAVLMGASVQAQEVFALTGKSGSQIIFNDFRSLDLSGGSAGKTVFSSETVPNVYSQRLKSNITETKGTAHHSQFQAMATLAEDAKGNLIYAPMYSSNVYIINGKSGALTLVENEAIKTKSCDITTHFTRMASGRDGNVYMLNNAGTSLVKISQKGGSYTVEDLGVVKTVSADPNFALSVMATGFGGDMVADADQNFYILAASGNVFRLNVKQMEAEYLGKINGLPATYSLNGAAVLDNGKVMVASAKGEGFYEVDLKKLEAVSMEKGQGLPVYDLASSNFLNESRVTAGVGENIQIDIYPTKIDQKHFMVRAPKGNYTVEMFDAAGSRILSRNLDVARDARVDLHSLSQGIYIVNVKDAGGKILRTAKVMVTN